MQGVRVNGAWAKSKKAVKEAVAATPDRVWLVGTSVFGGDYDGPVDEAPVGQYHFVGPDPYTSRKFYGSVVVTKGADGFGKTVVK